eukprot:6467465-Amphidinium_carterae.2
MPQHSSESGLSAEAAVVPIGVSRSRHEIHLLSCAFECPLVAILAIAHKGGYGQMKDLKCTCT